MDRKERLNEVFNRLRYEKVLSTKKDFAECIGYDKTNLSSAFGGVEKYLTDNLFSKIANTFPQFNKVWLLTGEGEMLKGQSAPAPSSTASSVDLDLVRSQQRTIEMQTEIINRLTKK